jgi:hypothetical protein
MLELSEMLSGCLGRLPQPARRERQRSSRPSERPDLNPTCSSSISSIAAMVGAIKLVPVVAVSLTNVSNESLPALQVNAIFWREGERLAGRRMGVMLTAKRP